MAGKNLTYRKEYYWANPEGARRKTREWAKDNPDRARASTMAHYRANMEAAKQRTRVWNAANPEAASARGRNYRARKIAAEGHHTGDEIKRLYDKQGRRCIYCHKALRGKYHCDHIQPLARGGSNWISNIQLLCGPCNVRKRATDPVDFARRIGLLI